jgi:hypothetical protein
MSDETAQPDTTVAEAEIYLPPIFAARRPYALRQPSTPLDFLTKVTREAPLGALCVAFLLGVIFSQRR